MPRLDRIDLPGRERLRSAPIRTPGKMNFLLKNCKNFINLHISTRNQCLRLAVMWTEQSRFFHRFLRLAILFQRFLEKFVA